MAKTYEAAVLPQQSWLDVVQTATGSIAGLVDLCYKNDISATAETHPGETIVFDEYDIQNRRIVQFFRLTPPPATGYVRYYEEWQWLKAGGVKLYLEIGMSDFDVTFKNKTYGKDQGRNSLLSNGSAINKPDWYEILAHQAHVLVWKYNKGSQYSMTTDVLRIIKQGSVITANGKTISNTSESDLWYIGNANSMHGTNAEYLISQISNRYYPCRLVRALPASKSWDGKPHPSGECGMWDKVSDKFFGNASGQGAFSVSN